MIYLTFILPGKMLENKFSHMTWPEAWPHLEGVPSMLQEDPAVSLVREAHTCCFKYKVHT